MHDTSYLVSGLTYRWLNVQLSNDLNSVRFMHIHIVVCACSINMCIYLFRYSRHYNYYCIIGSQTI